MEKEINVKIYFKNNTYRVKFRSSHFKGEMICKNIVELDREMHKIINAFPEIKFNIKFSEGALGRYTWELDSYKLLFKLGYKSKGYLRIGDSEARMFYNDELRELIIIDEHERLTKYSL